MIAAGIDLLSANGAALIAACWVVGSFPLCVLLGKVIGQRARAIAELEQRRAEDAAYSRYQHPAGPQAVPGLADCGHLVIVRRGRPFACPVCQPAEAIGARTN